MSVSRLFFLSWCEWHLRHYYLSLDPLDVSPLRLFSFFYLFIYFFFSTIFSFILSVLFKATGDTTQTLQSHLHSAVLKSTPCSLLSSLPLLYLSSHPPLSTIPPLRVNMWNALQQNIISLVPLNSLSILFLVFRSVFLFMTFQLYIFLLCFLRLFMQSLHCSSSFLSSLFTIISFSSSISPLWSYSSFLTSVLSVLIHIYFHSNSVIFIYTTFLPPFWSEAFSPHQYHPYYRVPCFSV